MSKIFDAMRNLVKAGLAEDVGRGDLTTLACLEPNKLKAHVMAKSSGVLSGVKPALLTFDIVDSANVITPVKNDGDTFRPGDIILEIDGFNQTVLTAERTALNFLGHLSGIASLTAQYVDLIKDTPAKLIDTRKTTPGWRLLEKEAVVHGGGENHRIGLYDMILIKENHITSAGSIKVAIERAREFLNSPDYRLQFEIDSKKIIIEVEITTEPQMLEAIKAGADRLLFDNQSTESLAALVTKARAENSAVKLEASGNVNLETIAAIADTGLDYISVGAVTHSAVSSDFSLLVTN